jgi:septum formation protein
MVAMQTRTETLILASQSPRRKELLDQMGLAGHYTIIPSGFVEQLDDNRSAAEVAEELGYGKALWVAKRNPGAWVIGSDTIVTINGKQLAKPADEAEARDMLKMLAGQSNTVTSSLVLLQVSNAEDQTVIRHFIGSESCEVIFKPYDEAAVEAYLQTGDWHDKAAAYGLQSGAHTLIDHFEGNYVTIIGLPTHLLAIQLQKLGFDVAPATPEPPVPCLPAPENQAA